MKQNGYYHNSRSISLIQNRLTQNNSYRQRFGDFLGIYLFKKIDYIIYYYVL